ncbi:2-dehydropantoate 2-reductase [Sphingomonas sp. NSE70-1]|uniref:2-dehydropantoate 2-reductase n=1 Tax=Sphingomonas caseinilyticus TaxID=2908205 RepID=A0ABT0RWV1_9SPHN|nr:2-dehydropantoate 2-reductase [Sphingomonas caseinilyticus]MCL6699308.1 2-dehydropantoate 2-reductase [Sphingomonas caseinilyticus]
MFGAGSIGCFVGGCWQAAGLDVRFIGRKGFADDIRRNGMTVSDYNGWQKSFAPDEVDYRVDPDALADADVIALCVKSGATEEAAKEIAAHGRPGTTVISFQNGISNVEVLERQLADRFIVVRGMVPYNVAYLGDGRFHKGVAGDLYAGDMPVTQALAKAIGTSPATLNLSDDMLGIAWGKLLINLNNAVNALSGRPLVEQLLQRDYRRVVAASQREGVKLLKRAGIEPAKVGAVGPALLPTVIGSPDWLFRNLFMKAWKIDEKARSSMADDLAAGRKTEVDYINGELVRLADRLGVDAPVNRKVVELIRKAESGAPPLPPAALRREVLGR